MTRKSMILTLALLILTAGTSYAQLDQTFNRIFDSFLKEGFELSGSPETHRGHFIPAAEQAAYDLSPALNSLIAGNVSSFPLGTSITVDYDFSTGAPVRKIGSLGPIFAESAKTLGKNRLNFGFNYTYRKFSKFRGMSVQDMRFTFTHVDVGEEGLGDKHGESDLVDLYLDLQVDANSYVFYGTYGVTDRFDVSLAIPVINVNLAGDARGVVQSFTFAIPNGVSQHQFGGDDLHPEFDKTVRYSESATGLGDLALRFKYNMLRSDRMQMAGLLDMRLPTGDEQNFLGNGKPNTRISWIMSNKAGQGTTHFNIGYERRGAELDSDELEIALGFDQLLLPGLTIAGDFVGEIDLNTDEAIELLPGYRKITDQPGDGASRVRDIDLSNIPERDNDNTFDLSLGMRVAASEQFSLLGNILVPLNEGGLRSTLTATIGVSVIL